MSSADAAKTAALLSEVDQLLDSLDLPASDSNQQFNPSNDSAEGDWSSYFGGDVNSSFDLGGDNLSINPSSHQNEHQHDNTQYQQFDANAEFDSIINGSTQSYSPNPYASPPTVSLSELAGHPIPHSDLRSPLPVYLTASPSPTAATAGDSLDTSSLSAFSSHISRSASPQSPALSSDSHEQSATQSSNPLGSPAGQSSVYDPSPAHGTAHFNTHSVLSPSVIHGNATSQPTNNVSSSTNIHPSDSSATESDPFASYFGSSGSNDPFGAVTEQSSHNVTSFAQSTDHRTEHNSYQPQTVADPVDSYFNSSPIQEQHQSHPEQHISWQSQHDVQHHTTQSTNSAFQPTNEQLNHSAEQPAQWSTQMSHQQSDISSNQPFQPNQSSASGSVDYFEQSSHTESNPSNAYDSMAQFNPPSDHPSQYTGAAASTSHLSVDSSPSQQFPHNSAEQLGNQSNPPTQSLDEFDSVPVSNAAAEDFLSYNPHAHRSVSQSISHSHSFSAVSEMNPVDLNASPAPYDAYQPPLRSPTHDSGFEQPQTYQPPQAYQPPTDNDFSISGHVDPSVRPYTRPPPHPIVSFGFGGRLVVTFPRMIRPFAASIRQVSANSQDSYEVGNGQASSNNAVMSVRPGAVRIIAMSTIAEKCPFLAPLTSFPGPLTKLKPKDKQKVRSFIDHVSEQYADRSIMTASGSVPQSMSFSELSHRVEASRLLWRALDILVDRVGSDTSHDLSRSFVDLLVKPSRAVTDHSLSSGDAENYSAPGMLSLSHPTNSSPSAHGTTVADSLALREKRVAQQSTLAAFPSMLIQGRKREAVELALSQELFDHALMLARDDDAMSKHVTSTICRLMDNGSILRTLYLVGAGMESQLWTPLLQAAVGQPAHDTPLASIEGLFSAFPTHPKSIADDDTPALINSWRAQVALCLANPSSGNAMFLQHMGDYLWAALDQPVAAHVCYIVSGNMSQMMSAMPTPNARVVLVGADHRRRMRLLADEEHLMATEIFEYTKGSDTVAGMLPYQFALAARLSDLGINDVALRYCEELNAGVKASMKRESQSNNQPNSSSINPLFAHQLSIFEHRLRVLLNAPATAPVSAKLVNGLFSVLDKGINMLVGQEAAPVSNSAGTESRSQWGEGGIGWDRKVMNKPLTASPLTQPLNSNQSIRAPSPVQMHSLDASPAPGRLSRPSTARAHSGDSLASSASMPLSRSGDIASQRYGVSSQSSAVPAVLTQAGFQPVEQYPPHAVSPMPTGQTSTFHRTAPEIPSQQHSTQSYQPPYHQSSSQNNTPGGPPAQADTPSDPAAAQTGPANGEKPGIIKRLGSVGGLFKMFAGAEKKPTTKEANLEQDHTFTWDEAQQKYVFRDKNGNEVVEQPETKTSVPPPAISEEMKQRWADQSANPSSVPSSLPSLPPPMQGGPAMFGKKGATVTNRYALSVGSEFTAPDTGSTAVPQPLFQPQFANDFSSTSSRPAQLYTPNMPAMQSAADQSTMPSAQRIQPAPAAVSNQSSQSQPNTMTMPTLAQLDIKSNQSHTQSFQSRPNTMTMPTLAQLDIKSTQAVSQHQSHTAQAAAQSQPQSTQQHITTFSSSNPMAPQSNNQSINHILPHPTPSATLQQHPSIGTPSRPPVFQPSQRPSPGVPAAYVPSQPAPYNQTYPSINQPVNQSINQQFYQPMAQTNMSMPQMPTPGVPLASGMPTSSMARPVVGTPPSTRPHYPQRPPPQY